MTPILMTYSNIRDLKLNVCMVLLYVFIGPSRTNFDNPFLNTYTASIFYVLY